MIRTIPMIRADDGKTADVHPDEVENWTPFGWAIDEARILLAREEAERREREAAEKGRIEAERKAADEEALRKTADDERGALEQGDDSGATSEAGAQAQQKGQGGSAPEQSEESAAAQPGSSDQGAKPMTAEGRTASEQANAGAGAGAGAGSASAAQLPPLTVGKGPKGLWFVKSGDTLVSKGFATEEEAKAAMADILAP